MKKEFTTLGQYFKSLGSQVMRSDTSSESNIVADEKPSLKNRLARHLVAGAAAVAIAGSANAAIVNWNCNLVPNVDIDGMYINVETQIGSNGPGSGVPGWDLNPYTSAGGANWFNSTGGGQMRYPGVTTGPAGNLAIGTTVGATGSYNTATTSTIIGTNPGNWQLNATNYLGFRFVSAAGTTHYGWAKIEVGAVQTARTIVQIAYESVAGTSINVGDDGLPSCTAPTLSATTVAALCAGNANGSIDLTATGGSPTPLIYAWSNGGSTEDLSGLTAGTYSVTVTTQTGGCSATGSFTVAEGAANVTYYADADGDTYGNQAIPSPSCTGAPVGYVSNSTDCDDGNAAANPGATEVCNGIDDDCNGVADDGLTFTDYYADLDLDGYGAGAATNACAQPTGFVTTNTDCDDNNVAVNPGATEVCNGTDDDCDGSTDEGVQSTFYADVDGDTYGNASSSVQGCTASVGYVSNSTDCNDANAAVNPGATEVCNGTDDDCDGSTDEGLTAPTTTATACGSYTWSVNGQTYTASGTYTAGNAASSIYTSLATYSAAVDAAGHTQSATENFSGFNGFYGSPITGSLGSATTWSASAAGGIYCGAVGSDQVLSTNNPDPLTISFSPSVAAVGANIFLTDINFGEVPGSVYITLSNGTVDIVAVSTLNSYSGYVSNSAQISSITIAGSGAGNFYVTVDNLSVGTGTITAVPACSTPVLVLTINTPSTYYADSDGDGYGNPASTQSDCSQPSGYASDNTDCNDGDNSVNPGVAADLCNGVDNDCDGSTDEDATFSNYYVDADGDGYGAGTAVNACAQPTGFVTTNTDCDDNNVAVNPGATEVCNGIDDDCDGSTDEGVQSTFYADVDGDTYGNASSSAQGCTAPVGYVSNSTDCNDASAAVNPGATEVCNGTDDDCDGSTDEGVQSTFYADVDGDTYGNASSSVQGCTASVGYVSNSTDCNDANAAVNPTATESCSTAFDDNCNGQINEGCPVIAGENPSNATSMTTSIWPNCNAVNGTLVNATASGSAQTVCLTGEDKWHQFVATSEGISIVVNSSAADILIELQTAAGVLVAEENAVAGLGGETLNHYGLTAGQVYKIGVRNYNSALGTGTYSICSKMLKRGGCDYGPGPYSLCQYFKATWAGATGSSYTFTFTGVSGPASGNVYTRTQTSDICVLSTVLPTLPYGSTYNVLITNTYTINNAAGVAETISVPGLAPCSMSTAAQPVTALRTSDRCTAGPRFRGSVVAALPWVCGATNWRWEFTELDAQSQPVGLPISVNRGAASNYINLGSVLQLQYGKTYSVRTAPILPYTGTDYQWGTPFCMSIVGSAGMIAEGGSESESSTKVEIANEVNMSLYPNPTHGTDVNINLSGVISENVQIRVVDAMGRQVWSNRYSVDGILNTNITFERPLANGLYFVEAIYNGELQTQRMMVQK